MLVLEFMLTGTDIFWGEDVVLEISEDNVFHDFFGDVASITGFVALFCTAGVIFLGFVFLFDGVCVHGTAASGAVEFTAEYICAVCTAWVIGIICSGDDCAAVGHFLYGVPEIFCDQRRGVVVETWSPKWSSPR